MVEEIEQLKISNELTVRVGQYWRIGKISSFYNTNPVHELTSIHKYEKGYYVCFEWEDRHGGETVPVDSDRFLQAFREGNCTLRRDILYSKLDLIMKNELNPWDY